MANAGLIAAVRSALQAASDPVRAAAAQQYLKLEMPSFGVRAPAVRRTVKDAARQLPPGSLAELQETALTIWREARRREERYAAIDLCVASYSTTLDA